MNKKEIVEIISFIKIAYPNSIKGMTQQELTAMVNLWHMQFADYNKQEVLNSINYIIANDDSNFMPSIARIKQVIKEHTQVQNVPQIAEKSDLESLSLKELERMVYDRFYPNLQMGE